MMGLLDNECVQRFKLGCLMGGIVGASMGALLGTFSVFRYGHHGEGFLRVVGRSALQSGSMFGLFMGIGGLIRCEHVIVNEAEHAEPLAKSYLDHYRHPLSFKKW